MLTSVFRHSPVNSPSHPATEPSTRSKPLLQKLLLRNLPGSGEISGSPTSSPISRPSVIESYGDSGSSTSSPVDRSSIPSPLSYVYHNGRRLTHYDSPERYSTSSLPSSMTNNKSTPRTSVSSSRSAAAMYLDPHAQNVDDWHRYPLVRQLSPIVEQDYVSPDTLRLSVPLPPVEHDINSESINEPPSSSVIRNGSLRSEITRPSPVYSAQTAFVSRQLNRSLSQTSSRTYRSTGSTPISALAPTIPPLDFSPAFPGPHPSNSMQEDGAQPLRIKPGLSPKRLSFAPSSGDPSEDAYSLHADSFITATERADDPNSDYGSNRSPIEGSGLLSSPTSAMNENSAMEGPSHLSVINTTHPPSPLRQSQMYDSDEPVFVIPPIEERSGWERDSPSIQSRHPSYEFLGLTPACWMFWLGFICPLTWIVGGWYFTIFQETGEDWRAILQLPSLSPLPQLQLSRSSIQAPPPVAKHKKRGHVLPLWAKRDLNEETLEHLTPQELELVKRLWTGYPFIEHVPTSRPNSIHGRFFRALKVISCLRLSLIGSPMLNSRRHLDPWIWRCRVALAFFVVISFAVLVVCLALFLPRSYISVS